MSYKDAMLPVGLFVGLGICQHEHEKLEGSGEPLSLGDHERGIDKFE